MGMFETLCGVQRDEFVLDGNRWPGTDSPILMLIDGDVYAYGAGGLALLKFPKHATAVAADMLRGLLDVNDITRRTAPVDSAPEGETTFVGDVARTTWGNVKMGMKLKGVDAINTRCVAGALAMAGDAAPAVLKTDAGRASLEFLGPTLLQVLVAAAQDQPVPDALRDGLKEAADLGQIAAAGKGFGVGVDYIVTTLLPVVRDYLVATGATAAANLLTHDLLARLLFGTEAPAKVAAEMETR